MYKYIRSYVERASVSHPYPYQTISWNSQTIFIVHISIYSTRIYFLLAIIQDMLLEQIIILETILESIQR